MKIYMSTITIVQHHGILLNSKCSFQVFCGVNTYAICGNANGTRLLTNNKLHATKPLIGEQLSSYRSVRRDEVVLSRLKLGHSYDTFLLVEGGATPGMCYV